MVRSYLFLILYSLNGVAFGADQSVLDVLMRMQSALHDLNYHGTLVYLQDGQVQSMRVIHSADSTGETERLINLNGVAREVVRKDDVVTCYMPDKKAVTVGKRQYNRHIFSKLKKNDFGALQQYYEFKLEAVDRIAGLKAQRIVIMPKDNLRYGYRLWLDDKNALLLKSDLLNESGDILEQAMFADIRVVNQIPIDMLKSASTHEGFSKFEHVSEDEGGRKASEKWQLVNLPEGFLVSSYMQQMLPDSQQPTEQWIVTDGLASVSVYVDKIINAVDAFEGIAQKGAVNIFGLLLNDHQITVVGEAPALTVELIARSVALN